LLPTAGIHSHLDHFNYLVGPGCGLHRNQPASDIVFFGMLASVSYYLMDNFIQKKKNGKTIFHLKASL